MSIRVKAFSKTILIGLGAFLLLSCADFFMTWKLISADASDVDEINPVAAWILVNAGWRGMAGYKLVLVAGITGVVLTIASRNPRVGESVMIFGCGAQAAIVITGLLLLRNSHPHEPQEHAVPVVVAFDPDSMGLPPGAMMLLAQPAVQKELQLSTAMAFEVTIMNRQRQDLRKKIRNGNLSDWRVDFNDQLGQEFAMAKFLTPKQLKRLQQISLQVRGPLAFTDSDVMDVLRFSDEQTEKMDAIREEAKIDTAGLPVQSKASVISPRDDEINTAKLRLWAVLDATQKQQWQRLLGQPFQSETQVVLDAEARPWSVLE